MGAERFAAASKRLELAASLVLPALADTANGGGGAAAELAWQRLRGLKRASEELSGMCKAAPSLRSLFS